ncbi:hypothetical protein BS47DRAFT_1397279 [Hydnum rufescens UP504]|uniref:Uncharacterized protein n=1 Tax=Hydnum rufescens UP504 TaxID=1448309 RepID=A0A9P6ANF9_9AGAM|nr:hypothetical protein BS47DRAFT_1397279 [Hydnum rufescens UP504]
MDAVKNDGIESIDTIADVNSLSDLDKTSHCLAELYCQDSDVDLSDIIKICFGIHRDRAGRYTLQRFNCYFFSWTILVVTARHAMPWDVLPFDSPWKMLSQTWADKLSTKFAEALINMMVDGSVISIMTMNLKLKPQLRHAVSRRVRLAWAMPQWLIRMTLRLMLRTSGRQKIETILRFRLRSTLLSALQPTLRSALADLRVSTLRTTLWKDDVRGAMRGATRRNVMASILDAATNALSSITLRMEDVDAFNSVAVAFAGRDMFDRPSGDWRAAFIAMFHAFMKTVPLFAAKGADGFVTDDTKWDEIWNSIRDTIREAANEAMKDVEGRWGTLWNTLMEEWVAAWEVIRPKIRDTARGTANEMTDLVNDALAYAVVKSLPDTHIHIAYQVSLRVRRGSNSKFVAALADVAHSELQPYMLKLIREHGDMVGRYQPGSSAKVEKDMREAMDRVWRAVVDLEERDADRTSASTDHGNLPIPPSRGSSALLCHSIERRVVLNASESVTGRESRKRQRGFKVFERYQNWSAPSSLDFPAAEGTDGRGAPSMSWAPPQGLRCEESTWECEINIPRPRSSPLRKGSMSANDHHDGPDIAHPDVSLGPSFASARSSPPFTATAPRLPSSTPIATADPVHSRTLHAPRESRRMSLSRHRWRIQCG